MKSNEWLSVMQQAEDYNPQLTPLIIKYGELLLSEHPVSQPVAELPKEAEGKATIKDYLENRIKGLYEADAAFCKDRWNMDLGPNERGLAREMSNQVTFARQELQEALKHI